MFARLLRLVGFVLVGAALASWLGAQPGMLQLEWLGWQLEMRTSLAVAILVILALALVFIDRLFRGLLGLPSWLGRNLSRRRTESGHRALTLGLMAVSAGEPDEARRQAARAQRLLAAPQLTDLLSAQAAHMSGDHKAAGRYFTSLTRDRDTAFLGHIGLARLALENDQPDQALAAARRVVAGAALARGLVGEARRLLEEIEPADRDAAVWRLMSRLAAEAGDSGAETDALREAGEAPRPRCWQCTACQLVHETWQGHCAGCAGFATLEWRRPDGVTPMLPPSSTTDVKTTGMNKPD
jgi:uncharacterized membrane-anchored protein